MDNKRRGRKSGAIYVPIAVLLILFLTAFGISAFLRVVEIEVTGASFYTQEEVARASGLAVGDNMILVDRASTERRIRATLPFVRDVRVGRAMPGTILIEITESAPMAWVRYQQSVLIVDSAGRVLERVNTAPEGLIEVIGLTIEEYEVGGMLTPAPGAEARLGAMEAVLDAIENTGLTDGVSRINVTNVLDISFEYQRRFTVQVGNIEDIAHRMSQLPEFIDGIAEREPNHVTGSIDMSGRNDPRMRWIPNR